MERRRQVALAGGAQRRAEGFAASLRRIARDGAVLAAAISEPGQDLTRPGTRATRTPSGWRIDGRKMFCTMSPAATDLYVAVTYADDEGVDRYAYAHGARARGRRRRPRRLGRLGMRASGSHSIVARGRRGARGRRPRRLPGRRPARRTSSATSWPACSTRPPRWGSPRRPSHRPPRPGGAGQRRRAPRMQVADNAIDLAASRAILVPRGCAGRRPPRRAPGVGRRARGPTGALRGGPGRQGVRQRGRGPGRRPRAGAVRRRRLPQRQPARARLPRRAGRGVHAPAGRQPRLRLLGHAALGGEPALH